MRLPHFRHVMPQITAMITRSSPLAALSEAAPISPKTFASGSGTFVTSSTVLALWLGNCTYQGTMISRIWWIHDASFFFIQVPGDFPY